jgi:hypothetical protein
MLLSIVGQFWPGWSGDARVIAPGERLIDVLSLEEPL